MSPRAHNLSITTTIKIKTQWQPPRDPTPRYRATFSPISLTHSDIPPVPALSFFDADTPIDKLQCPESAFSKWENPRSGPKPHQFQSMNVLDLAAISPSVYSPSLRSPTSVYSPLSVEIPQPPSRPAPSAPSPSIYSATSPTSTYSPTALSPTSVYSQPQSSSTMDFASSTSTLSSQSSRTSTASSTSTTASTAPSLSQSHKPENISVLSFVIPELPMMSPLLSPRYMFPRTPPAVPSPPQGWEAASDAKLESAASTVTLSVPYTETSKTSNSTSITLSVPYIPSPRLDKHRSAVGWGDIRSPIRLDFEINGRGEGVLRGWEVDPRPHSCIEEEDVEVKSVGLGSGSGLGSGLGRASMFVKSEVGYGRTTKAAKRVRSMWSLRGREVVV